MNLQYLHSSSYSFEGAPFAGEHISTMYMPILHLCCPLCQKYNHKLAKRCWNNNRKEDNELRLTVPRPSLNRYPLLLSSALEFLFGVLRWFLRLKDAFIESNITEIQYLVLSSLVLSRLSSHGGLGRFLLKVAIYVGSACVRIIALRKLPRRLFSIKVQ